MDRPRPLAQLPAPGPALGELRRAVTAWCAGIGHPSDAPLAVAVSGGADSLALAAAVAQQQIPSVALIVDHQLQRNSGEVAHAAAAQVRRVGLTATTILEVDVDVRADGLEAGARAARYAALDAARSGCPVLLAHTLDDQAETVLLGLARGSGARSLAGMAAWNPPWGRPLLGVRRAVTHAACAELAAQLPGFAVYDDPHNIDPRFARSRLRGQALPVLQEVLGDSVAVSLARSAELLRRDADALDEMAAAAVESRGIAVGLADLPIAQLTGVPLALRGRILRSWLTANGCRTTTLLQVRAIEALVDDWRGQGPVAISGPTGARTTVSRVAGELRVRSVR